MTHSRTLTVAGLFAGIGGVELGLRAAGHHAELLCELEPAARAVLAREFDGVPIHDDVTTLRCLPTVDLLAAGFPCQDLSLAGTRAGLEGKRSGLVWTVLDLIRNAKQRPEFVLLENVSHLLRLGSGVHMRAILESLEELGYRWAYRVVDSRGFGLPQRRLRVIILASRGEVEPGSVLFADAVQPEFDDSISELESGHAYGFYWTEGKRGVGWAKDAVPTIKGGSGLGIPSPPAVFRTDTATAGTPTIEDAERLQGFDPGWTDVELNGKPVRAGARWKMVGNAVSVPVAEWVGSRLAHPSKTTDITDRLTHWDENRALPNAAMGAPGQRERVEVSTHVQLSTHKSIMDFLHDELKPLSPKALRGYIHRAETGTKRFPPQFLAALSKQASGTE